MNFLLYFLLLLENNKNKTSYSFFLTVEVTGCNVMIVRRNVFDQPATGDVRTYGNVRKITTGHTDNYKIGCLLNYSYFKENFVLNAVDRSKQQAFDDHPKAIQQINFTGKLH